VTLRSFFDKPLGPFWVGVGLIVFWGCVVIVYVAFFCRADFNACHKGSVFSRLLGPNPPP